jgi:hypothetical protein
MVTKGLRRRTIGPCTPTADHYIVHLPSLRFDSHQLPARDGYIESEYRKAGHAERPKGRTMRLGIFLIAVVLSFVCAVQAQQEFVASPQLPDSPSAQKFWTLENKIDFSIFSAELAADAITTQLGLSRGLTEANPLARPLVTRGALGQAAASGLSLGAGIGVTYLLHRTHHHRAERIAACLMIAGEGAVVSHNIAALR